MKKISLGAQLEEIDREIELRRKVYPRLVAKREIRESLANLHIARLEAVRATLAWLQANEGLIKARLANDDCH
jgi:hypothetical protein